MDMSKLNIPSIIARIKAETPPFWIKVRKFMIVLGGVGGAIAMLPAAQTAWLPVNFDGILVTIGAVGTALSSLTAVQSKSDQP